MNNHGTAMGTELPRVTPSLCALGGAGGLEPATHVVGKAISREADPTTPSPAPV